MKMMVRKESLKGDRGGEEKAVWSYQGGKNLSRLQTWPRVICYTTLTPVVNLSEKAERGALFWCTGEHL